MLEKVHNLLVYWGWFGAQFVTKSAQNVSQKMLNKKVTFTLSASYKDKKTYP